MKLTVTFTDSADFGIPDGAVLTFENVRKVSVSTPADVEQIGCDEASCKGCTSVHRRLTGVTHLKLGATGSRDGGPLWVFPEAVT